MPAHPPRRQIRVRGLGRYFPPTGSDFVSVEALGGVVLLAAAVAALVLANSGWGDAYADLWAEELTVGFGPASITESLQHWINDGLMAVFFFVVGLEIKRELVRGELRDRRTASLPAVCALGGMLIPAALFLAWNPSGAESAGWGIPMATDIAFAVGVLTVLGSRIPTGLKLFLLTLAIVDDLGAILVIALFYSGGITPGWLLAAVAIGAGIAVMARAGVRHPLLYVVPAIALWVCTYESGVHATIAGVTLGLLTPAGPRHARLIERLEHALHPWTSFLIVPLFALANAGVDLRDGALADALDSPVTWGVMTGLVVGKLVGISGAAALGVRLGLGRLPEGVGARHVLGVAALAGIGFTVSLFIADLSYDVEIQVNAAKVGILGGSVTAGILGGGVLLAGRRREGTTSRVGPTPSGRQR